MHLADQILFLLPAIGKGKKLPRIFILPVFPCLPRTHSEISCSHIAVQLLAFWGDESRQMLKIMRCFGKRCGCRVFALKAATAVFDETLDNFQPLTRFIPEA